MRIISCAALFLVTKTVVKVALAVALLSAWLVTTYVHNRVWTELPELIVRDSLKLLPNHGCITCERSLQNMFLCEECVQYNMSNTRQRIHTSRHMAVDKAAYLISEETSWYLRRPVYFMAREMAVEPAAVLNWMQAAEVAMTLVFFVSWLMRECRSATRKIRLKKDGNGEYVADVVRSASAMPDSFTSLVEDPEVQLLLQRRHSYSTGFMDSLFESSSQTKKNM